MSGAVHWFAFPDDRRSIVRFDERKVCRWFSVFRLDRTKSRLALDSSRTRSTPSSEAKRDVARCDVNYSSVSARRRQKFSCERTTLKERRKEKSFLDESKNAAISFRSILVVES